MEREAPPLHGKFHFKFPFYFRDELPYVVRSPLDLDQPGRDHQLIKVLAHQKNVHQNDHK